MLLVQPYKNEILAHWRFKMPAEAKRASQSILKKFRHYVRARDFVGAEMARKFLQMGYARSRRYTNHPSGRKYDSSGNVFPYDRDPIKAQSARIFYKTWKQVEKDAWYAAKKLFWKERYG